MIKNNKFFLSSFLIGLLMLIILIIIFIHYVLKYHLLIPTFILIILPPLLILSITILLIFAMYKLFPGFASYIINKTDIKYKHLDLEKRYKWGNRFKWLSYLSIFIFIVMLLFLPIIKEPFYFLSMALLLIALFSLSISSGLLTYDFLVVYSLKKFKDEVKIMKSNKFFKGLLNYKKSLDLNFSTKELYLISQYVNDIYTLGGEEEIKEFEGKLDKFIERIEVGDDKQAIEILLELAGHSKVFIEKYKNKLGYDTKLPLTIRKEEIVGSVFTKALPEIVKLLCIIAYIIISFSLPLIKIPFP